MTPITQAEREELKRLTETSDIPWFVRLQADASNFRNGLNLTLHGDFVEPEHAIYAEAAANSLPRLLSDLDERDAEIERLKGLIQNGFDVQRVMDWQHRENRPLAVLAFMAGGERQAAYLIEMERIRIRDGATS